MGTYNTHHAELTCPWCHETHRVELQFKLGRCWLTEYTVGDRIEYTGPNRAIHNGGRPPDGDWIAEGYGECPSCERDFFVDLPVRGDRFLGPDETSVRKGMMAGELGEGWGRPP